MNKRKNNGRKDKKQAVRTLILPFTVTQDFECILVNCYDHEENISVKGLWKKQDTVLDLVENLPKFYRWMKSKHRSLGIMIRNKEHMAVADCEISHADGELHPTHSRYIVNARPIKNN